MQMKFDHILNQQCDQGNVFDIVKLNLQSFVNGINNTIFAYGQTGAGKTYTTIGDLPLQIGQENSASLFNNEHKGIIPRAL